MSTKSKINNCSRTTAATYRIDNWFCVANGSATNIDCNRGAADTTKRKAATKATEALQPSQKRKRSSPSITEPDESLASKQTCPPTVSSTSAPTRQKRRHMIKQQQIQNKYILRTIQNTAARNQNEETDFSVDPAH